MSHSPSVGLVHHPLCLEHDTGPGQPERPDRLRAVERGLRESGLWDELDVIEAPRGDRASVELLHEARYVDHVERTCARAPAILDGGDTVVSAASFDAALRAVGGVLEAVDRVRSDRWSSAFVSVRPPGHHAEPDRAMGFCLFGTIALAAAHLRANGVDRVAIVDFDVHHGNGTQHLLEEDPTVFYASLHQAPLWPGTGGAHERGRGAGEGATLNCPQPPGADDRVWLRAMEEEVIPALEEFAPQFLLISAGFDAHVRDPLANTALTDDGYVGMTESLVDLARRTAKGRIVSMLEGGYDLEALASAASAHVRVLRERAGESRTDSPRAAREEGA